METILMVILIIVGLGAVSFEGDMNKLETWNDDYDD
ncbi:hypothetical protein LCGC14_1608760 [marine sediment metagenome]|uniref:Uncharacterized protein n=1 Tax=marine sediment metagenome TaxID=412755 RepID=A0A0F9KPV1_9ZZZZ